MHSSEHPVSPGVLDKDRARQLFETSRVRPSASLRGVVSHYWMVRSRVPEGYRLTVAMLGRLGCSIVVSEAEPKLYGVQTARFTRELRPHQRIVGVKLAPAGVRALTNREAHEFTDRTVAAREIRTLPDVTVPGWHAHSFEAIAALLDERLAAHPAREDPSVHSANEAVRFIAEHPRIRRVAEIAERTGMSVRTLQELMRVYIGVPAKWTIDRLRIIHLVRLLEADDQIDLATVAAELGYYDQAHMTTAFRAATGTTPHAYRTSQATLSPTARTR